MGTGWKNFDVYDRKKPNCTEDLISENNDIKVYFDEGSEGSEEYSRESVLS